MSHTIYMLCLIAGSAGGNTQALLRAGRGTGQKQQQPVSGRRRSFTQVRPHTRAEARVPTTLHQLQVCDMLSRLTHAEGGGQFSYFATNLNKICVIPAQTNCVICHSNSLCNNNMLLCSRLLVFETKTRLNNYETPHTALWFRTWIMNKNSRKVIVFENKVLKKSLVQQENGV